MSDLYTCDDIFFAATLMYAYGPECLRRIEIQETRRAAFVLEVPSLDAVELWKEYLAGKLAVSDVRSLARNHGSLAKQLRELNQCGDTTWEAPRSEAWWKNARQAVQQRQREREHRDQRVRI
jgi:hypothetical protein